jgi:5-methyltetrahydropteroyltriglutamate--homocysteine methyltransferase
MDFGVGVIDGKNLNVESPEWIADGIREVLRVIPPERVSVYTDYTLIGLKHIVAKRKIESLVAGTRLVRAELTDKVRRTSSHRPGRKPCEALQPPR